MLVATTLCLALQSIEGLRAGEVSTTRVALAGEFDSSSTSGRLLHAHSGIPIDGASIEAWKEVGTLELARLASATSLVDGSFRIRYASGERADKLLIRAEGFRDTTVSPSEAHELLLWPAATHLALRAVDLEGKPIANALAQTRQTCAHAPSAYVGRSDADGRFDLARFPPLEDEPEIVVTAPGFGALLLQLPEQMLAAGGLEVRLPRRRAIAFSVVDHRGAPLAGRGVSLGVEPHWLAGVTDARGRIEFPSAFFGGSSVVSIALRDRNWVTDSGCAFPDGELRFAIPREDELGLVQTPPIPEARRARVELVDAQGRTLDAPLRALRPDGSELPGVAELDSEWGPTTLIAGGPFSGWNRLVRRLDKPANTTLQLVEEPRLTIELPEGYWTVHVQCGDDSVTLEGPDLPLRQPVPAGGPLIVCAVGLTQTRIVQVPHIAADASVDLRPRECVVAERVGGDSFSHITLRVPEAKLAGHVRTSSGRLDPAGLPDEFTFRIQTGACFEGVIRAPGRLARGLGPTAEVLLQEFANRPELPRLCSLRVRGDLQSLRAGGAEAEGAVEGGFLIEDLAPGPLLAQVQLADGRVIDLSLILKDGESRELRIEEAR